jgi:hypothetical protein
VRTRLDIATASGSVVLSDSGLAVTPPLLSSPSFKRYFRELADQGRLFLLDGEERSQFRLLICVDEDLSDLPTHRFRRLSGSFLLPVPSGRLLVSGHAPNERARELEVPVGTYAVSVLGVGQGELDGAAFQAEQLALLGRSDWRFHTWVGRLGVVGLVPFFAAFVVIIIYRVSVVSLVATLIGMGSLLPRLLIARTQRYRRIERRLHEHETSFPHFVLELRRVESTAGLVGGHFVV